jgi:hypothetical protein
MRLASLQTPVRKFEDTSGVDQDDRQSTGAMSTEDDNAFDVAGSTGAGDEPGEAGIALTVSGVEQFKRSREIGQELVRRRNHNVMRREH